MLFVQKSEFRVPDLSHKIMTGTHTNKVVVKKDYFREDGPAQLYL